MRTFALAGLIISLSTGVLAQSVSITTPANKALIQQIGGTANISVSASASEVPSGGGVEFILDIGAPGQVSVKDYSLPYEHTFENVPAGEHTVDAYVVTSSGTRLSAHDRRTQVGVGDLIIAMGDSITAGEYDDILTDNWSADGRNGPRIDPVSGIEYGGFQPILNDLLTAARGYPHSVINQGIPGEKASQVSARVSNLLSEYPTARTWLVSYGTNDANSKVSATTYSNNLKSVYDQIQAAIPGASVYFPKVFYFDETDSDRSYVLQYHDKLGDLTRNNANAYWGADLETLFRSNHAQYNHLISQSGTWLDPYPVHHPNGVGIQKMAMLWKMALVDRAIIVTDGYLSSAGGSWADKIQIEGAQGIGLHQGNLLQVCEQSAKTPPAPNGTEFANTPWSVRLQLTGGGSFGGGLLQVTTMMERDNMPSDGRWEQAYNAAGTILLATSRAQFPGKTNYYLLTSPVWLPGQIAQALDLTPPTTSAVMDPAQPNGENGWYVTNPSISLNGVDGTGWPLAATFYRWDSGAETAYSAPLTPPAGTHSLYYYSKDWSNNIESWKSSTVSFDPTSPETPAVTDGGRYAEAGTSVNAGWTSADSESGIAGYEYAVGTWSGGTDVQGWTSAGSSTSVWWNPWGPEGLTYYFSVRAKNLAGLDSPVGISDGITLPIEIARISEALGLPEDVPVLIRGVITTASAGLITNVQEEDRSAGIPVECETAVSLPQSVTVIGRTSDISGERALRYGEVRYPEAAQMPKPLAMINRAVNEPGNPRATGLLVTVWGSVKSSGEGWILISDGSDEPGVLVDTRHLTTVPSDGYVVVSGIASVMNIGGVWKPCVRPRWQSDLVGYQ